MKIEEGRNWYERPSADIQVEYLESVIVRFQAKQYSASQPNHTVMLDVGSVDGTMVLALRLGENTAIYRGGDNLYILPFGGPGDIEIEGNRFEFVAQ